MDAHFSARLEQQLGAAQLDSDFVQAFEVVANYVAGVAATLDVPPIEVTAVVADDFCGEVDRSKATSEVSELYSGGEYRPQRLGAVAIAQTTQLSRDASRCRIVFDRSVLTLLDGPHAPVVYILNIAHEMAHTLFFRLRWASGAMTDADTPYHPFELARVMTRNAADEMRCDIVANFVLGLMATQTTAEGQTRPVTIADAPFVDGLRVSVGQVLDETIYPGWPDLVDQYRDGRLALNRLWSTVINQSAEMLSLLAYAQVPARAADRPGPLEAEYAEHPATCLYLGPAWVQILDAADDKLVVPLGEFREREGALVTAGEAALVDMWKRVGLTFGPTNNDGSFHVGVAQPAR